MTAHESIWYSLPDRACTTTGIFQVGQVLRKADDYHSGILRDLGPLRGLDPQKILKRMRTDSWLQVDYGDFGKFWIRIDGSQKTEWAFMENSTDSVPMFRQDVTRQTIFSNKWFLNALIKEEEIIQFYNREGWRADLFLVTQIIFVEEFSVTVDAPARNRWMTVQHGPGFVWKYAVERIRRGASGDPFTEQYFPGQILFNHRSLRHWMEVLQVFMSLGWLLQVLRVRERESDRHRTHEPLGPRLPKIRLTEDPNIIFATMGKSRATVDTDSSFEESYKFPEPAKSILKRQESILHRYAQGDSSSQRLTVVEEPQMKQLESERERELEVKPEDSISWREDPKDDGPPQLETGCGAAAQAVTGLMDDFADRTSLRQERSSIGTRASSQANQSRASSEQGRRLVFDTYGNDLKVSEVDPVIVDQLFSQDLQRAQTFLRLLRGPNEMKTVRIAVLDTGLDMKHPLLREYLDDGRIHPELTRDFTSEEGEVRDDSTGHGTHCVHLILKTCPFAVVYVAKVLNGAYADEEAPKRIAQAIHYATRSDGWNVDIVSMSFAFSHHVEPIYRAIMEAHGHRAGRVLFFSAASNYRHKERNPVGFPASMASRGVICAFSSTPRYQRSDFSPQGHGMRKNFCVPGEQLNAAYPPENNNHNAEKRQSGTSMATAVMVGMAALVLDFSRLQVVKTEGQILDRDRLLRMESMQAAFKLMLSEPNKHKFESEEYLPVQPWLLFDPDQTTETSISVAQKIENALRESN